jgi:hypothetical protein
MHEYIRNAGMAVLLAVGFAWFIGFLAMMFRSNPNPYGWFGLLGGGVFILLLLLVLRREH